MSAILKENVRLDDNMYMIREGRLTPPPLYAIVLSKCCSGGEEKHAGLFVERAPQCKLSRVVLKRRSITLY